MAGSLGVVAEASMPGAVTLGKLVPGTSGVDTDAETLGTEASTSGVVIFPDTSGTVTSGAETETSGAAHIKGCQQGLEDMVSVLTEDID